MPKVAFVVTREPHIAFGQVGLEIMAAILKQNGIDVIGVADTVFDPTPRVTMCEAKNLKILEDYDPDFVGISTLTHRYQWNLKFARQIKERIPDTRIIMGGPHPTAVPDVVAREDCIDYVCVGEGEGAILDLVTDPDRTDIPNIYPNKLRPLITDLDSLPFPDKSIWIPHAITLKEITTYLAMSARGCPYECRYCFNCTRMIMAEGLGPWLRYRSAESVVREIEEAKKIYPLKFVLFQEDNLGYSIEFMREFAPRYRDRVNLPYTGNTHPLIITEECASLFSMSNCKFVMLGLQSGNEELRRDVIGRHETNEWVLEAAALLHKYKIPFSIDHLFGLPGGDTLAIAQESARLYNEMRPFTINTYRLYLLPKVPIIADLNLPEEDIEAIEQGIYQEATIRATDNPNYVNFRNFFVYMPLLPKSVCEYITNRPRLIGWFGRIPEVLIWAGKGINNIKGGNEYLVRNYLQSLPRFIRQRLSGYRGEFAKPEVPK